MPSKAVQTLDARYIDGAKLVALLQQLFGVGHFGIDVRPIHGLSEKAVS
jgi:hypothetical protein